MNFSLVLYFDKDTEVTIQNLMQKLVENGVNDYLTANHVPPHISIADFDGTDVDAVINAVNSCIKDIAVSSITLASIGLFNPSVLFLAPITNRFLADSCTIMNNMLSEIPGTKLNEIYTPYKLVPHVTIAARLSETEAKSAVSTAIDNFKVFEGSLTRLALVQNKPRLDLKVWDLTIHQ